MLIGILIFDVALVAWSLHLMEERSSIEIFFNAGWHIGGACRCHAVFLMGNCMSYLMNVSEHSY